MRGESGLPRIQEVWASWYLEFLKGGNEGHSHGLLASGEGSPLWGECATPGDLENSRKPLLALAPAETDALLLEMPVPRQDEHI